MSPGPVPSSPFVSRRMGAQQRRDTRPEMALRRAMHAHGLRYRVHVRPVPGLRREADIAFTRAKVAVFVMGCFWHGCPRHATWPRANADWWRDKIERNRARDRETARRLRLAGWTPVVVWEHEDPEQAALRVLRIVRPLAGGTART